MDSPAPTEIDTDDEGPPTNHTLTTLPRHWETGPQEAEHNSSLGWRLNRGTPGRASGGASMAGKTGAGVAMEMKQSSCRDTRVAPPWERNQPHPPQEEPPTKRPRLVQGQPDVASPRPEGGGVQAQVQPARGVDHQAEIRRAGERENETDWDRQRRKRVGIMEVLRRLPAYEMLERARLAEIDTPVPLHLMNDPDPCEPCSKRRWEIRFRSFKSQLHEWFDDHGFQGPADAQQSVVPENPVTCMDPRHYALSVVCPLAGIYCSCLSK